MVLDADVDCARYGVVYSMWCLQSVQISTHHVPYEVVVSFVGGMMA
jgi:hypothetical protein